MPTTPRARYRAANRGQADDHRIARGQIELIDALSGRLARLRDRVLGFLTAGVR